MKCKIKLVYLLKDIINLVCFCVMCWLCISSSLGKFTIYDSTIYDGGGNISNDLNFIVARKYGIVNCI